MFGVGKVIALEIVEAQLLAPVEDLGRFDLQGDQLDRLAFQAGHDL